MREMDALMSILEPLSEQQRYKLDPVTESVRDRQKGRGVLLLNPELPALKNFDPEGAIVLNGGKEYRVTVDAALRGMRIKDEDGISTDQIHPGFWVEAHVFDVGKWPIVEMVAEKE